MKKDDFLSVETELVSWFPENIKPAIENCYASYRQDIVTTRYFTKFVKRALFNHTNKKFSDIESLLERKEYYNKNYGEKYYENKIQNTDIIGQGSEIQ